MIDRPWISFALMIGAQTAFFFAVRLWPRHRNSGANEILIVGLLGRPLGIAFDFAINRNGWIFTYALGHSFLFVIANGLLSYGAAAATTALIPFVPQPITDALKRRLLVWGIGLAVLSIASLWVSLPGSTTLSVFSLGALIVACTEVAYLSMNVVGPIASAAFLFKFRPFVIVWTFSIAMGLVYEIANNLFPVWHWEFAPFASSTTIELLVVVGGYFVLVQPLLITAYFVSRARSK